jgi:hypothetical protein
MTTSPPSRYNSSFTKPKNGPASPNLMANRNRKENIELCRKILGGGKTVVKENVKKETWQEQLLRICSIDVLTCPVCQIGRMSRVALLLPYRGHSP